jgi:hypothetical protein
MKPRHILLSLCLAFTVLVSLGLKAQEQATPAQDQDKIILNEQQLKLQFQAFTEALLKLQQKLARGTPQERQRAEQLAKVLKECNDLAIDQEFTKLLEIMKTANMKSLRDLERSKAASDTLAGKLRVILELMQDSNTLDLSKRSDDIRKALKLLDEAIERQQIARTVTQIGKADKKETAANQDNANKAAKDVLKAIDNILKNGKDGKDGKDGKGGEAGQPKEGDIKGEGKNEGKGGEAKNDGKSSPAEAKGSPKAGGDSDPKASKGETKPGSDKAGQPSKSGGEPKSGAKPGEAGKDSPPAGAKSQAGGKDSPKDAGSSKKSDGNQKGDKNPSGAKDDGKDGKKSGDPMKDGPPPGSAKSEPSSPKSGGDPKSAAGAPPSDSKAKAGGGDPSGGGGPPPNIAENKNSKGSDKGGEGKAGGAVGGGDGKQGESKPGSSSAGQSAAKEGGAAPMAGSPPSPPPGGSAKDGGSPPPPGGGDKKQPKETDDIAQSHKKVEEAGYDQKKAQGKIEEGKPKDALKNQADAIAKMEEAKKKLENLLRQMREEEIERVLAALQARCEKMLMMQIQVLGGTEETDRAILKNADKKPNRDNKLASLKLSDTEKEIIQEANKCIQILESEGSAVAFPEVFQQLRSDMMHVQKRLDVADVFATTQDIENDIIDTLKEMIKALEKARQDNQSDPGKGGPPGKSGKPADPKLLELIQELKMVRSLQKRVNDRTEVYGKRYPGEQAADPQIVRELRSLADRQQRIQEIVRRIANGDNK